MCKYIIVVQHLKNYHSSWLEWIHNSLSFLYRIPHTLQHMCQHYRPHTCQHMLQHFCQHHLQHSLQRNARMMTPVTQLHTVTRSSPFVCGQEAKFPDASWKAKIMSPLNQCQSIMMHTMSIIFVRRLVANVVPTWIRSRPRFVLLAKTIILV